MPALLPPLETAPSVATCVTSDDDSTDGSASSSSLKSEVTGSMAEMHCVETGNAGQSVVQTPKPIAVAVDEKLSQGKTNKVKSIDSPCSPLRSFLAVIVLVVFVLVVVGTTGRLSRAENYSSVSDGWEQDDYWTSNSGYKVSKPRLEGGNYRSGPDAPFDVTLAFSNEHIMEGYSSQEELRNDLENAAKFFMNNALYSNVGVWNYEYYYPFSDGTSNSGGRERPDKTLDDMEAANDFGANKQEDGVREGDLAVTNGVLAFAASSGDIVIWNPKDGVELKRVSLPAAQVVKNFLLIDDHLVVTTELQEYSDNVTLLGSYFSTATVFLHEYKITSLEEGLLRLIRDEQIKGHYVDTKLIGDTVHLVTIAVGELQQLLSESLFKPLHDLYRSKPFESEEEYFAEAKSVGEPLVESFVNSVLDLISIDEITNLPRLSLMRSNESFSEFEEWRAMHSVFGSITLVSTLVVRNDNPEVHVSVILQPCVLNAHVYASTEVLIFASTNDRGGMSPYTDIYGFDLDGFGTNSPAFSGIVEGVLTDSHALDIDGDILRLAVTAFGWMEEDATDNAVIIYNINGAGDVLEELGRLDLGKPNEVITAVAFYDNVAYVTTFDMSDPMYILDLSDPASPRKISELEVSGRTDYMHPLNSENTWMLTLGEEADEFGHFTGFMIMIYDMTTPSLPKVTHKHHILNSLMLRQVLDPMSIRYTAGRLIFPLANAEGETSVRVFKASETGIEPECTIPGQLYSDFARAFVIDGDVMTISGTVIKMTDHEECSELWQLDLAEEWQWN